MRKGVYMSLITSTYNFRRNVESLDFCSMVTSADITALVKNIRLNEYVFKDVLDCLRRSSSIDSPKFEMANKKPRDFLVDDKNKVLPEDTYAVAYMGPTFNNSYSVALCSEKSKYGIRVDHPNAISIMQALNIALGVIIPFKGGLVRDHLVETATTNDASGKMVTLSTLDKIYNAVRDRYQTNVKINKDNPNFDKRLSDFEDASGTEKVAIFLADCEKLVNIRYQPQYYLSTTDMIIAERVINEAISFYYDVKQTDFKKDPEAGSSFAFLYLYLMGWIAYNNLNFFFAVKEGRVNFGNAASIKSGTIQSKRPAQRTYRGLIHQECTRIDLKPRLNKDTSSILQDILSAEIAEGLTINEMQVAEVEAKTLRQETKSGISELRYDWQKVLFEDVIDKTLSYVLKANLNYIKMQEYVNQIPEYLKKKIVACCGKEGADFSMIPDDTRKLISVYLDVDSTLISDKPIAITEDITTANMYTEVFEKEAGDVLANIVRIIDTYFHNCSNKDVYPFRVYFTLGKAANNIIRLERVRKLNHTFTISRSIVGETPTMIAEGQASYDKKKQLYSYNESSFSYNVMPVVYSCDKTSNLNDYASFGEIDDDEHHNKSQYNVAIDLGDLTIQEFRSIYKDLYSYLEYTIDARTNLVTVCIQKRSKAITIFPSYYNDKSPNFGPMGSRYKAGNTEYSYQNCDIDTCDLVDLLVSCKAIDLQITMNPKTDTQKLRDIYNKKITDLTSGDCFILDDIRRAPIVNNKILSPVMSVTLSNLIKDIGPEFSSFARLSANNVFLPKGVNADTLTDTKNILPRYVTLPRYINSYFNIPVDFLDSTTLSLLLHNGRVYDLGMAADSVPSFRFQFTPADEKDGRVRLYCHTDTQHDVRYITRAYFSNDTDKGDVRVELNYGDATIDSAIKYYTVSVIGKDGPIPYKSFFKDLSDIPASDTAIVPLLSHAKILIKAAYCHYCDVFGSVNLTGTNENTKFVVSTSNAKMIHEQTVLDELTVIKDYLKNNYASNVQFNNLCWPGFLQNKTLCDDIETFIASPGLKTAKKVGDTLCGLTFEEEIRNYLYYPKYVDTSFAGIAKMIINGDTFWHDKPKFIANVQTSGLEYMTQKGVSQTIELYLYNRIEACASLGWL